MKAAKPGVPAISFLIPVYNGLEFTRDCLRTLAETVSLADNEVIIIDDGSTDGTAEFLATLPYRIIQQPQRRGYAAAMNRGVTEACGELLCLLNNDLVFTAGWLESMLVAMQTLPSPGLIGNIQKNARTKKFDHMGVVFDREGMPWHFGKYFGFFPFGNRHYSEWKAVTAACCLVKKDVLWEAGGFDEQYRNGSEDIDLGLKLGERGYRHYVANQSLVWHHVSHSEGRHDYDAENQQRFRERWAEKIIAAQTPEDRRAFAVNYLLRFMNRPWRYNGKRLWNALTTLTTWGR